MQIRIKKSIISVLKDLNNKRFRVSSLNVTVYQIENPSDNAPLARLPDLCSRCLQNTEILQGLIESAKWKEGVFPSAKGLLLFREHNAVHCIH